MKRIPFIIIGLCFALASCEKDKVQPVNNNCDSMSPTYTADVKAILDTHCATSGCHSANSRSAGLNYSNYASTVSSAGNNNFIGSIKHEGGFSRMPKGQAKLSDEKIRTIECWIANGTPQ